jgi:hypothetical protein
MALFQNLQENMGFTMPSGGGPCKCYHQILGWYLYGSSVYPILGTAELGWFFMCKTVVITPISWNMAQYTYWCLAGNEGMIHNHYQQ